MSTLKLPPSKSDKDGESRKSVRRADPNKRQRASAPVKPVAPKAEHKPEAVKPERQRNHRHDGKPRESATPDSRAPAERPVQRGEFKRDEFKRAEFKPSNRDATGRDTPRRGGKARDGFEQGDFNRDRATNPMFASKPVASNPDFPRLSKRMAELGLCSRREADEWIVNGWVKVDGEVIDALGTRISPEAKIEISKAAEKHQSEIVTILLHKPVGYVSGQAEDNYEPAIVLVHPDNQWEEDPVQKPFQRGFLKGLAPAGRLDIDSTGLLVLTQDGRVAKHLIGENSTVEKEYLVRVEGALSDEGLKRLNFGLALDGVNLKPAKVSWQNEDQLRFVLREGKKRQIRRMCELVGLHVVGLKRVRIGSVSLGKLPMGKWRYLRPGERF
ncbi:MAG: pseudouridine synthase [Methylophilaceae bacterium]|nr:pseudouridine synthase [Methylophilaceae bacterium]